MSIAQSLVAPEMHSLILERDDALAELERAKAGVTVCVPCFEQSDYLTECLQSIATQTVPAFETIVVDDGSHPLEANRIELICRAFEATRYVRVTNRGLVGARNTALMLTRTFAFLPLDADDWLQPDYLARTVPLLADADVVVTGIQEHGARTGTYKPGFDTPFNLVTSEMMRRRQTNLFYYASLFRTDVLRECGGYNAHMNLAGWEDWDLWHDLLDRRVRFAAADAPLFNYRCRPGSMAVNAEQHRRRNLDEMARHHRW